MKSAELQTVTFAQRMNKSKGYLRWPELTLLLEIAIAARSTAQRLGAVLVRSLVKVRSSPNAESRLFARDYMVVRVNASYVACSKHVFSIFLP